MHTITSWIERKLGLKVNMTKTKVTTPKKLKYLGFGFWKRKEEWKARPHQESVQKFKRELKRLTRRSWSIGMTERIKRLNWVIRGWINYFRMGNMKDAMSKIDEWMRTRIRIIIASKWWYVYVCASIHHLEAMENEGETTVGTYEIRCTRMDGKTKRRLWRPLSSSS